MATIYFLSYALIATVAGLVIAWAQYSRMKNEGVPMNFKILKAVTGTAVAMYAGAALTSVAITSGLTA